MPREVSERAHALARGDSSWQVPPLRDATTVVLVRNVAGGVGLETYLMRRVSTMAFAAGMHVFPGGRIDDADIDATFDWVTDVVDPDRMTADRRLARGLIVCAVRELFEETGVLLAVDDRGNTPVEDDEWETDRAAVLASSASLSDVLARRGLALDPGLLPLWTHWVTPEVETRRYDVRFFIAQVPAGQTARDVSGEADRVWWISAEQAMLDYYGGRLPMLPPTAATISDLVGMTDVTTALAAAESREVRPLMPRPRLDDVGGIAWDLIDVRDGTVIVALDSEPAGSEVHGTRGAR